MTRRSKPRPTKPNLDNPAVKAAIEHRVKVSTILERRVYPRGTFEAGVDVQLSEGHRGRIVHALRIAAERFDTNSDAIRAEAAKLEEQANGYPGQVETFRGLADQMDFQAHQARDDARLLENCQRALVTPGLEIDDEGGAA